MLLLLEYVYKPVDGFSYLRSYKYINHDKLLHWCLSMYDSLINSKHSKIGVCVCQSNFCVVQSKINVMYIDVKVSFGPNQPCEKYVSLGGGIFVCVDNMMYRNEICLLCWVLY